MFRSFAAVNSVLFSGLLAIPGMASGQVNLISIVTDDQAQWAVGAYGNRDILTPNMDRLAEEGALFRNAFVATPVCSPSRASFLTGLYPTQVGISDWIAPVGSDVGVGIAAKWTTWPEILQANGYATALVGKWHLGMEPQFHPTRHGFDLFYGFRAGGARPRNPELEVEGRTHEVEGYLADLLVDRAIRFLEDNRSRPFALLLHFRAPHRPYLPVPEPDWRPFRQMDPEVPEMPGLSAAHIKQLTREYYASVRSVDRNLGRLMEMLKQLGLDSNTVVLFTSDHGYMIGHHGLHSKGNAYWVADDVRNIRRTYGWYPMIPNMYEESIRVPLLIRWPGQIRPGTRIDEPVSNVDIFPTVLKLLGIPAPSRVQQEGRDFSPLLRGEKIPWREEIFGQYDVHNSGLAFMRMIRTDRWKLVRYHMSNYLDRLYDLKHDPGEMRNLYRDPGHQEVRQDLTGRLQSWQRSIDDPVLRWEEAMGR